MTSARTQYTSILSETSVNENYEAILKSHNLDIRVAVLFFYENGIEFCCHGALFLWQHQHLMTIRCFSNMVVMTTFTCPLHKVSAHLKDKTCTVHIPWINLFADSEKMVIFNASEMSITQHIAECYKVPFVSWGPK